MYNFARYPIHLMQQEAGQLVVIIEDDLTMGRMLQKSVNEIAGFRCDHVLENPLPILNKTFPVDIVLLDVSMPGMSGLEAIEKILIRYPEVSIVMNTIRDDDDTIFEALQKGAIGYMVKHATNSSLTEVLRTVGSGGAYMTPVIARKVLDSFLLKKPSRQEALNEREQQVVESILDGLSYKLIGDRMGVSINTVRKYIKRIYRKLNINSKGELYRMNR